MSSKNIVIKGMVLSEVQHKEYNKILTVLTAEKGIIRVYAYGALSVKNKNFAPTQPFAFSEMELTEKGDMYTLRSASLIRFFSASQKGIASNALMIYFSEFLMAVCCEDSPEEEMMRLALNIFHAVCEGLRDTGMIKAVFEVRAAAILGFAPELSPRCGECGSDGADFLDYEQGCLMCASHGDGSAGMELTVVVIAAMEYIMSCDIKRILAFCLEDGEMRLLKMVAEGYILHRLDRGFSSLGFYKQVSEF